MADAVDLKNLSNFDENGIIRPEKLALVHITDYMPKKVGDRLEIKSTANATDCLHPRNTIHFTIGHHVDAVVGGANWAEKGIMVVAPLKDTMDENGKPMGMSSHDTFFETTPGRNLKLPKDTHIFISTTDSEKLNGALSQTEGNITYYKASGYTAEEKKQIFKDILVAEYGERYQGTLSIGKDRELTQNQFVHSSDALIMATLKKVLLSHHLKEKGFIANSSGFRFNEGTEEGAKAVYELGKKLGCYCYSADEELHHRYDFAREDVIAKTYDFMMYSDILLHSDNYEVISSRGYATPFGTTRMHQFQRKSDKSIHSVWGTKIDADYVDWLKNPWDVTGWMEQTMEMSGYMWTPAFRETYEMWMKKTKERMDALCTEAKGVDLDAEWTKIQQKMQDFDKTKGGLLTRAFAQKDKSPERRQKADGLLKLLRERDSNADRTPLYIYQKGKKNME
ncbi:MAG: hypothetical protein IKS41_06155 [Alphaproteobacteria bacterium]|nr:hypothetical protein [Alphaproteobacteria bacterium]